ncbi:hypothetical protein JCM6882_002143 [Rhodosporidiobolus microsporus]
MAGRIPVGSAIILTGVITSIGYGIMALTTPSEEQFYNSLAPDLKRKVDEAKRLQAGAQAQNERLAAIRAQADQDRPVFADDLKGKK